MGPPPRRRRRGRCLRRPEPFAPHADPSERRGRHRRVPSPRRLERRERPAAGRRRLAPPLRAARPRRDRRGADGRAARQRRGRAAVPADRGPPVRSRALGAGGPGRGARGRVSSCWRIWATTSSPGWSSGRPALEPAVYAAAVDVLAALHRTAPPADLPRLRPGADGRGRRAGVGLVPARPRRARRLPMRGAAARAELLDLLTGMPDAPERRWSCATTTPRT